MLLAAGALFLSGSAFAQDAVPSDIAAADQSALTPTSAQDAVAANTTVAEQSPLPASEVEALQTTPEPVAPTTALPNVTTGAPVADTPRRFQYTLSLSVRGVYDDNIDNSSFNRVSDYYFAIEPSIFLGFGSGDSDSSLSLIYHPSVFLYVNNSQNDAFQNLIRLQAAHRFSRLSLSFSQDVQLLDGTDLNSLSYTNGQQANIDVSGRTRHQVYTSQLSGSYDLTGKLFLSGAASFFADQYQSSLNSSETFSGNLFINYNYSEKVVFGLGGTGGYNTTENSSSNQTFEQINVRLSYSATAKISLSGSVGAEFRQFENNGGNRISPVFELSASYQPFDGTSLSLSGSSNILNSASSFGEDYAYTTINFALRQRFLQRMFFGMAVGYTNNNYFSTATGTSATRNDNYYYVQPNVDLNVTRYWTLGAYYMHRQDSSNLAFSSFYDNQVGVRSTLTF